MCNTVWFPCATLLIVVCFAVCVQLFWLAVCVHRPLAVLLPGIDSRHLVMHEVPGYVAYIIHLEHAQ